jgi:hypothetical protein
LKKLLVFLIFITSIQVNAQTFRNYSNEFLNIGVDAAAVGMSKSVVATSNDVNAVYWNPAGLLNLEDYEGSLMHASYFAGIANYNYAAIALPIDDDSAIGLSVIRFGVDDILNTTELIDNNGNINFNNVKLFSAADYAFNLSYARNLVHKDIHFGVNAKVIRRIIGDFATSWGFGFDAGIQFQRNDWMFGLVVKDVTTTYNTWSIDKEQFDKIKNSIPGQNQELPETTEITKPKIQLGVARKFRVARDFHLLTEVDLNMRFAQTNDLISSSVVSVDPTIGFELDYTDIIFLRAGIGNIQNTTEFNGTTSLSIQPNLGVGFKYNGIEIDYALTNIGSIGNAVYSNIFSIKIDYKFFRN